MTSGMKFHDEEIEFVSQNMHEFPSILARSLGLYYPQHNGGYRNTKSVSLLMNKIRTNRDPNSPDLPEDEAIEPNTLMRDLPPVTPVPKPDVTPLPVTMVAEVGTKEIDPPQITEAAGTVQKIGSKTKGKK